MFIGTLGFFIYCDLFCDTKHILEVSVPRNVLSAKTEYFCFLQLKMACGGRELGGLCFDSPWGLYVKAGSTTRLASPCPLDFAPVPCVFVLHMNVFPPPSESNSLDLLSSNDSEWGVSGKSRLSAHIYCVWGEGCWTAYPGVSHVKGTLAGAGHTS